MLAKLRWGSSKVSFTYFESQCRKISRFLHDVQIQKEYTRYLKICADTKAILHGQSLHCHFLKVLATPQTILLNSLANMYIKCDFISNAEQVFYEMPDRDVVSWNIMISGYLSSGHAWNAFVCFRTMLISSFVPDQFSLNSVLECCVVDDDLRQGLQVHGVIFKLGLCSNAFVSNGLIGFYEEFGCFFESMKVFDQLQMKDDAVINTVIKVYAKVGNVKKAFENLQLILSDVKRPTTATFVNFLGALSRWENLSIGVQVHSLLIKYGFENHGIIENSLVRVYCNCDAMSEAFRFLIYKASENVMSWTTLISQYSIHGCFQEAINVFQWLYHHELVNLDESLLACVLKASAAIKSYYLSTQIHSIIVKTGTDLDQSVANALLDIYASCFCLNDMDQIFQLVGNNCNLQVWTTMISGNVRNSLPMEALSYFSKMLNEGIKPDAVACVSILKGCTSLQTMDHGEMLHAYVIKTGNEANDSVQTALCVLYSDFGYFGSAKMILGSKVKYDVVSVTALISGYAKFGYIEEALLWFRKMLREEVKPNNFNLSSVLTASARSASIITGKSLHCFNIKLGTENDNFVASSMIDMYSKCGAIDDAVRYFNGTQEQDIVVWNSLLAGLAHCGNGKEVLKAFDEMQICGIKPDEITFLLVLSGCSHGYLANQAMEIFSMMLDTYKITQMAEHHACVIDALGRAGLFRTAVQFIDTLTFVPCMLILRSLLSCCVLHGCIQLGLAVVGKIIVLGGDGPTTFVLFSKLCATGKKWDDTLKLREMIKTSQQPKNIGNSWIESRSFITL